MAEQHDPIEELSRFGADLAGGTMPMSAADARRRGDKIRRRRTAIVAGGAAFAVAAVAVPVFALLGSDSSNNDRDRSAGDPTTSDSLSPADLLADADTEYRPGEKGAFTEVDTYQGDGQATFHQCQQEKLSSLGATDSYNRRFDWPNTEPVAGTGLAETIAEFDDAEAARAAYDEVGRWMRECRSPIPSTDDEQHSAAGPDDVVVPDTDAASTYLLRWGPVPNELDPTGEKDLINETGLVLQDNRIAVVSLTIVAQDYSWPEPVGGGSPITRMLPTAAERLKPGANPTSDASTDPTDPESNDAIEPDSGSDPGDAPDPAIPDDFALAAGLPDIDGDGSKEGPARNLEPLTFEACGTTVADADHADRLLTTRSMPEDYQTRQLTTYDTADDAVAAVAAIRKLYLECPEGPTRDDGFTPNYKVRSLALGGESFAVLSWDELDGLGSNFGASMIVVRVGNAVLIADYSGHAGNPQGREQEVIDQISRESAPVIDDMCLFTVDGC